MCSRNHVEDMQTRARAIAAIEPAAAQTCLLEDRKALWPSTATSLMAQTAFTPRSKLSHTYLPQLHSTMLSHSAVPGRQSATYRYMRTVAMRCPPFAGMALNLSWKKSWCGSYFCPST